MDGKQASEFLGITYADFIYLHKRVNGLIGSKYGESRGRALELTHHDLARLKLAVMLRDDGYQTPTIQQAIDELNNSWNGDDPANAGILLSVGKNKFRWVTDTDLVISDGKNATSIATFPYISKFIYNIRKVAYELYEIDLDR